MSDEALSVGINKEPHKAELGTYEIIIPKVYAPLFTDKEHNKFLLSSGRISGKTSALVALVYAYINSEPDKDIVILQATSSEIKDSIILEIEKFFINKGFDVGDKPNNEIYIPAAKDKVIFNDGKHKGGIYIFPITDSKGGQRARGITTKNPISLILFEEVQKNKDANVVNQALATFIRQAKGAKIVVVGNNETLGHWFTNWVIKKRKDKDWVYIYACYLDIWGLLNKETQDFILNFKRTDPQEYRRMYLGDVRATINDKVFPQFVRGIHYKLSKDLIPQKIIKLIIGIDHATANDKFAVVPVAILADGTCQTLQICVDNPLETQRSLAPTEQCDILDDFMQYLDDEYGFSYNATPIIMSIDGAASPFIAQVKHTKRTSRNKAIWRQVKVCRFTMKKKDFNMGLIKSAFALNVIKILNEGKYEWNGARNHHWLCHELEAQRYKNGKLDPAIPNDVCDALEYGLIPYYTNCYNLSWPIRATEINKLKDIQQRINIYGRK